VLLRLVIRRLWVADLIAVMILAVGVSDFRQQAAVLLPAWLAFLWLLRRFGLLAFLTVYALQSTLVFTPYSIDDLIGRYFMPIHLVPAILAVWALWVIASDRQEGSATAVV
jgi:hypothetical protein